VSESKWEIAGEVAVDAGMLWIGDPCYVFFRPAPADFGANWKGFVQRVFERERNGSMGVAQFRRHPREEGYVADWDALGCTVATGFGDGVYTLEVRRHETGRIAELRIKFLKD
jgi:hypothetical protein